MIKTQGVITVLLALILILITSCADPSDGRSGGSAPISRDAVSDYLSEVKLNSPGVAAAVTAAVNNGQEYREKIKDQNNKPTTLTAWIDKKERNLFCITYYRDEICPKCHGTGYINMPSKIADKVSSKVNTDFKITCNQCHGEGYLKNKMSKKCWILGLADYKNIEDALAAEEKFSLKHAPAETQKYIKMLASQDPSTRLEACEWLDRNYVHQGRKLIDITPILDRARFVGPIKDNSLLRKVMGKATGQDEYTVYQFWAGKGDKELANKAYYRIYVNATEGVVLRTAFAPDKSVKQRRRRR